MKRTIKLALLACLFLLLASVFSLTACNNSGLATESTPQSGEETNIPHYQLYCKHDDPAQIVVIDGKKPTCYQTGLTEGMRCNLCGTMVVPQTIIPVTICSSKILVVDKVATPTEDGYQHWECTECGKIQKKEVLSAASKELEYFHRVDGTSCEVSGIGSYQDADLIVDLIIPAKHNGIPVKRIDKGAFWRCDSIVNIVIQDGVIAIGDQAFWYCSNLKSITIPHSVGRIDSISGIAFTGCTSLSSIYFDGTMDEWNSMAKNTGWNICSNKVTVFCIDGNIVS